MTGSTCFFHNGVLCSQCCSFEQILEGVGKSHSFIFEGVNCDMKTTEAVDRIVRKTVEDMGFSLCDVEFQKEYGNWVLTLFIDKPGGVTIDDCEAVSKAVDPVLDEADPIAQAYYLSVSSLGIDRPLKKDADFERNLGKEITARLYAPVDGRKEITGVLQSYSEDSFDLICEKETITVKRKDAALVKPFIRF